MVIFEEDFIETNATRDQTGKLNMVEQMAEIMMKNQSMANAFIVGRKGSRRSADCRLKNSGNQPEKNGPISRMTLKESQDPQQA